MSAPICPRYGSIHAANHPTGERPCVRPAYPRMSLVLVALLLCLCALYFGAEIGRWIVS